LDDESLKLVLLRGVLDEWMDTLNLIAVGDIFKCTYDEIRDVLKNYSKVATRSNKGLRSVIAKKYSKETTRMTNMEIRNLI
jgi:hypothetical protein